MFEQFLLGATALALLPAAAPPAEPAAAFGARESVLQTSLSPNGSKVAFIAPGLGQSTILYVADASGKSEPIRALGADGKPERLHSCNWVSEARLVCTVYMVTKAAAYGSELVSATRLVATDIDGKNVKVLTKPTRPYDQWVSLRGGDIVDWLPGDDGAVLMGQNFVPEQRMGTNLIDRREGYGVERIDTATLSAKLVERPNRQAGEYITDGRGTVRIMATAAAAGATGYDSGKLVYFFRKKGSRDWQPLSTYNISSYDGFYPVAVDPDLDLAYGFRRKDGRDALYSIALDGSGRESLVFAHPQVDVDDVVRIGRNGRVVGASFATEKRDAVYFDTGLAAIAKSLARALPGLPQIRFVDSSVDENKLLIWAGSDNDAGRYYLFDRQARSLAELMLARPQLEHAQLATMKPVTYKAGDGTLVPAYLTLPPAGAAKGLPAIVMPHGGPSARDEWGFDWLAQFYASRGFAVLQPNYRGSAGYGDAWFQNNGFQSWRTAIGDVNDAGRWLVSQGIADPAKLATVGWSYGGYAALQSGALDPDLFKAVVAIAPVTDLPALIEESRGWTHHRVQRNFIGSGPHLQEGSPTHNAAKLKAPVLIFHGELDRNVRVAQARSMKDKLEDAGKRVELVVYPELDHYLDDGAARTDMLRRSDAFLRKALAIQ